MKLLGLEAGLKLRLWGASLKVAFPGEFLEEVVKGR